MPPLPQVLECTNLDYSCRQKKLGRAPPLRLWPTWSHLHMVSYWAALLQVVGILVSLGSRILLQGITRKAATWSHLHTV